MKHEQDYEALSDDVDSYTPQRRSRFRPSSIHLIAFLFLMASAYYVFTKTFLQSASNSHDSYWAGTPAQKHVLPYNYEGQASSSHYVNETLGFQKIIALNMPHRMDRKDELVMLGAASGLKIDVFETQYADTFKAVGLPYNSGKMGLNEIGCYRAHLDIWQQVVSQGISSALVIEDDADWDVDLKYAVRQLWQPLASLIESRKGDDKHRTSTSVDPWMTKEWDVLFLGACFEWAMTESDHPGNVDWKHPPIVAYDDYTVADENITEGMFNGYMNQYGYKLANENDNEEDYATFRRQRLIAQANGPICTAGYAVSKRGAAKLLYQSSRQLDVAIDVKMSQICRTNGAECYITVPPIIAQWRTKDGDLKNSEIRGNAIPPEEEAKLNHNPSIGMALNIRNSARKNLQETLRAQ